MNGFKGFYFKSADFLFLFSYFMDFHKLGSYPVAVGCPQLFDKFREPLGSPYSKWFHPFFSVGIPGGEKKGDKVGSVIGVEMGYENIVDFEIVNPYFLKFPYRAVSAVKKGRAGTGTQKISGRTSFLVGHAGTGTQNSKFHHLT